MAVAALPTAEKGNGASCGESFPLVDRVLVQLGALVTVVDRVPRTCCNMSVDQRFQDCILSKSFYCMAFYLF